MFSNPLIQRYRYSQLRPRQLWVFGALYLCILFLILSINASAYRYGESYSSEQDMYKGIFVQLSILQVLILWIIMPMNTSNVIPREISDQSIDFFRMLPLSSVQKATGILVGRNLFGLIVAAINLCLCAGFGFAGELEWKLLLELLTMLVSLAVFLNSSSLLFSVLSYKKNNRMILLFLIFALFGFGPVMGLLVDVTDEGRTELTGTFYGFEMPLIYLVSAYLVIAAAWSFIGILRRFTYEYEPLFSRRGAVAFLMSYIVLAYALFYSHLTPSLKSLFPFYIVILLPVAMIPFLSARSFDWYIEITRLAKPGGGIVYRLFVNSNFLFNILLFGLWLVFSAAVCYASRGDFIAILPFVSVLFTHYLVIVILLETHVVYFPCNDKIGYLMGFLGGLYAILPLILAGVFDYEQLALFSPMGVFGMVGDIMLWQDIIPMLVFDGVILMILLFLVIRRYVAAGQLRTALEK